MKSYRIYYSEREVKEGQAGSLVTDALGSAGGGLPPMEVMGDQWEETVDASSLEEAMETFFREHGVEREAVHILEEEGNSRPVEAGETWDPDRSYVWMEEGKFMEFEGLDERAAGMVDCPLCDGEGEVAEAIAEDYMASQRG
jgi:hypothetical protein